MFSRSLVPLAVALLAVAACSDDEPLSPTDIPAASFAVQAEHEPASPSRPIKLDYVMQSDWSEGVCEVSIPGGPTVPLPVLVVGQGTTSHRGRTAIEIRHLQCGFDPAAFVITFGGTFRDQGANGDRTMGTWTGHMNIAGELAGYFFNTIEITGGTGHFENAVGQIAIRGWKNLVDPTAAGWFEGDGWISY